MTPKEIGRAADSVFHSIRPPNWAVRDQQDQEDYGIDYEIELMRPGDKPSGFIFKVQQKGAVNLEIDEATDRIVYSDLKVARMKNYLHEIHIPTILLLVDITTREVFWSSLQGNREIETAYRSAVEACQKTMTVRVPRRNKLPATQGDMLAAVERSQDAVALRCLMKATSSRVLAAAINTLDFEKALETTRRHGDFLRLREIENYLQSGQIGSAIRMSEDIWTSPSERVELRFAAAINIMRIRTMESRGSPQALEAFLALRLIIADDLITLMRQTGSEKRKDLLVYAYFLRCVARIGFLADQFGGQQLSEKVQQQGGDEASLAWISRAAKTQTLIRAVDEFSRTQSCIAGMVKRRYIHMLPQAWAALLLEMMGLIWLLRGEGAHETANNLSGWFERTFDEVIGIAARAKNWNDLAYCAIQQITLAPRGDRSAIEARVKRARDLIETIEDPAERQKQHAGLDEYVSVLSLQVPRETTPEEELSMVRAMARSMGVDLNDPDDPVAGIVNIGIQDMNPERVLKKCKHLFLALGPRGIPAQMFALPTAGSKSLHCTKFGYGKGGLVLDGVTELFVEEYCSKCSACEPHPEGWKWSRRWQNEQCEKHRELGDQFWGTL